MKKIIFILILLAQASMLAQAQRLSMAAEIRVPVVKTFDAYASMEYRTRGKFAGNELFSGTLGVDYKILPWLKAAAGYTYITARTETEITNKNTILPPYWKHKHKGFVSLTGSYEVARFTFSLRERYQYTHTSDQYVPKFDSDGVTQKEDEYVEAKHSNILRSRIQVKYDIRKCKFSPYLSGELYNSLSDGFSVDQTRWTVGVTYKPSKKHELDFYYRYVDKEGNGTEGGNIIGIKYYFKL